VSDLLDGLRRIVIPARVADGADGAEIRLGESNPNSRCQPVLVDYRGSFWALRIESNDHLKVLAGSNDEQKLTGFSRLPDWLVFCEPTKKARKSHDLWVIVCELKSGSTGATSAKRQVQLGKFLVEYLVRLATFALNDPKARPRIDIRGLVVSPRAPAEKGDMSVDGGYGEYEVDVASDMAIFLGSDKDVLRVEDLFR
jgi:hypothetical protein